MNIKLHISGFYSFTNRDEKVGSPRCPHVLLSGLSTGRSVAIYGVLLYGAVNESPHAQFGCCWPHLPTAFSYRKLLGMLGLSKEERPLLGPISGKVVIFSKAVAEVRGNLPITAV